jgi:hypothetical protein
MRKHCASARLPSAADVLADNVAEIIRLDRLLAEAAANPVVSLAAFHEFKWLKQQRAYQVRAITNYKPPNGGIR